MYPHTDWVRKVLRIRLRNSSTHFWGCAIGFDPSGSNHCPAHSWTGRYVCGEIRAQPSRQSNLTLRYGRKICHRNFLNLQLAQKVQRRIKFFRFVRRLHKFVRLRSSFSAKIMRVFHSCQIFSAGYTSRLYKYLCIYNRYCNTILLI